MESKEWFKRMHDAVEHPEEAEKLRKEPRAKVKSRLMPEKPKEEGSPLDWHRGWERAQEEKEDREASLRKNVPR